MSRPIKAPHTMKRNDIPASSCQVQHRTGLNNVKRGDRVFGK